MKRIKKLIIANLVVILIAIIIFTASMYFGGPALEEGSRDILVLAGDNEQQGGSVDMAYMVHLENGSLANFTPIYPGGMIHPTQPAPGNLGGNMRMHDCLWDGADQGAVYAQEIVEYNTGMHSDAVVIIYADAADAVLDTIRPIKIDGVETNLSAEEIIRSNDGYFGYGSRSGVTGTMSRNDAVMVLVKAVSKAMKDPDKKQRMMQEAMNQYNQGNIIMKPEGSFMRLLSTKGLESLGD